MVVECSYSFPVSGVLGGALYHGLHGSEPMDAERRQNAPQRDDDGATGVGQGAGLVPPATPPQPSW
jgi:hypothetical protein